MWAVSILAIGGNAVVNMHAHVSVFCLGKHILQSGIAGSYGIVVFKFLRNCQNVFHNERTILVSYQQCLKITISSTFANTYFLCTIAILVGIKWYLTVV